MPGRLYRIVTSGRKPRVITFDRNTGIGAAPESPTFVRMMRPEQFLKLAAPTPQIDHRYILRQLHYGRRGEWGGRDNQRFVFNTPIPRNTIANPFLQVNWDETKQAWDVKGHEGRHRSFFLTRRGNPLIPVDIRVNDPWKHRVTSEMKRAPFLPQSFHHYAPNGRYNEPIGLNRSRPNVVFTGKDKKLILLEE